MARRSVREFLRWQRVPVSAFRLTNLRAEIGVWLGFAVGYIALAALTGLAIRAWPLPWLPSTRFHDDLWYVLFKGVGLLAIPLALFALRGGRLRDLSPQPTDRIRTALWAVLAFALGLWINNDYLPLILDAWGAAGPLAVGAGVVLPLVTAAIPEELVYRGILQTRLEAAWGRPAAVIVTAILFTAWHLPTRYLLASGVEGTAGDLTSVLVGTGIPVFIVALIFGLLWDRYRALPPLIAAHWGIDLLPTLGAMFGVRF